MDTNSNAKWRLDLTWVELYEDFIDGEIRYVYKYSLKFNIITVLCILM